MNMLSYWKSLFFPNFSFSFIGSLAAGVSIVSGISSLMGGSGGGSQAGQQATNTANPLAPYQQGWAQQLDTLMNNPSSVTQTPGYQFGMDQGAQQLQRSMAGAGQTQSGQEQIDLQKYGQGYAGQQYQQQISTLGNLATGNAVQGQQAGMQQTGQGWGNIMQGAGALSNIYGGNKGATGDTGGYQDLGTATPSGNTGTGFYPSGGAGYDVGNMI